MGFYFFMRCFLLVSETKEDFQGLEPYDGKLSRTVLRGERGSNALDLPGVATRSREVVCLT